MWKNWEMAAQVYGILAAWIVPVLLYGRWKNRRERE
jgi:hypothetical protein